MAMTLQEFQSNAGKKRWAGTTKKQRSEYMKNLNKLSHAKKKAAKKPSK